MKSKVLMALAAGAVALPMAIGSTVATAMTVAPPPRSGTTSLASRPRRR